MRFLGGQAFADPVSSSSRTGRTGARQLLLPVDVIALARKYRPRTFGEVAVQDHVSHTLKGAIARGRVAHGYLLCGPRGVGKTTLARVLAMALNCEVRLAAVRDEGAGKAPTASTTEPCGDCASCSRIWSGSASMDVVEIDAASNRGVDDARELRERAMYAPSGDDRWKVYIVDEAHMLTREAWNALLKVLEEPPPRVVFVFATTEPQKIAQAAAPVLSRLQRFDFKRMSPADVRKRLTEVLAAEGIDADSDAIGMLARAADGSMRDALSLTDQVLALGGEGAVTAARVRDALGLVPEDEFLSMLAIVAERRAADVFAAVGRLVNEGVDLGQFLSGFADMVRAQLAVVLGAEPDDISEPAREALRAGRERLSSADLVRMLSTIAEIEPKFRRSTQQQLLLEMLLVRFALLDRTLDIEMVLKQIGTPSGGGSVEREEPMSPRRAPEMRDPGSRRGMEAGLADVAPPRRTLEDGTARRAPGTPTAQAAVRNVDAAPTPVPHLTLVPSTPPAPAPSSRRASTTPARSIAPGGPTAAPAAATVASASPADAPLDLNTIVGMWDDLVDVVRRERPMIGSMLEHFLPTVVTAKGVLTLQAESTASFEGLSARLGDLTTALKGRVRGLSSIALRPPAAEAAPARMSHETVRSDRVTALRKRDPVLRAAIDELDLELLD